VSVRLHVIFAFAQNASNPQSLTFTPSADHYATSSSGEPVVTQYNLEIYEVGASTPLQVNSVGKPAPVQTAASR
jgi:hypothetical protein